MNGPDHYREAERLLADSQANLDCWTDRDPPPGHVRHAEVLAEQAQVHATLAQCAATIDTARIANGRLALTITSEWDEAQT